MIAKMHTYDSDGGEGGRRRERLAGRGEGGEGVGEKARDVAL